MAQNAVSNDQSEEYFADARKRMVDSQIRPNRVSDPRLLETMRHLRRESFLPQGQRALAYADQTVPLGGGRVLLQPMVLAKLLQAAMPLPGETALVVGAGTGYAAALLAGMGCLVTALEEAGPLADRARSALASVVPPVTLVAGSLAAGWASGAPYDVILIDGGVPEVPSGVAAQLKPDSGRLLAIVCDGAHSGQAVQAEPTGAGVSVRALFDCQCPILPGFARAPSFQF